jgi:acyl carrier protein
MENFRIEVNRLLCQVLEIESESSANLVKNEIELWDSLKSIEILMLIEESFGIHLSENEMTELNSTNEIMAIISEHLKKK